MAGSVRRNEDRRAPNASACVSASADAPGPPRETAAARTLLPDSSSRRKQRAMVLLIPLLTIAAYLPGFRNGYTGWDDTLYIRDNPQIARPEGLGLIWTTSWNKHYYPLTFTTLWLEHQLWGTHPPAIFGVNLLLHALNCVLVYALLRELGANARIAWLSAALFGLHPIQVASVAWLVERKNVLSIAFALLSFWFFVRHCRTARVGPYVAALVAFALALLSKTAVVTLPISMLLAERLILKRDWKRSVIAVLPMLALSAALGIVTVLVESAADQTDLSIALRPLAPAGALWFYIWKLLAPIHLMPIYAGWDVTAGSVRLWVALVAAIVVAVFVWRRRVVLGDIPVWGLCHFVLALLPMLGFLRFDFLHIAPVSDHFVYLAAVGLFAAIATWIERVIVGRRPRPDRGRESRDSRTDRPADVSFIPRANLYAVSALLVVAAFAKTIFQVQLWRDELTLWSYTADQNPNSTHAQNNLGNALGAVGRLNEAVTHNRRAIELDPGNWRAQSNLGVTYLKLKRMDDAMAYCREACRLAPDDSMMNFNLGCVLAARGQRDEAARSFREATRLRPDFKDAYANLGIALRELGRFAESIEFSRTALGLDPDLAAARANLALALEQSGDRNGAIEQYTHMVAAQPKNGRLRTHLATLLSLGGDLDRAKTELEAALDLDRRNPQAHFNLAVLLVQTGELERAEKLLRDALTLRPAYARAATILAPVLAKLGRLDDASAEYRRLLSSQPKDAELHYRFAALLLQMGKPDHARPELEQALQLARESENSSLTAAIEARLSGKDVADDVLTTRPALDEQGAVTVP